MRAPTAGLGIALSTLAACQTPDVRVRLDATFDTVSRVGQASGLRLYGPLGRTSTLGFTFLLEPGLRAFVAQRLQHIPGDPDLGPLDQYYVEDEGIWRVGKQYLPFGSGTVLRESVLAARADTNLIFENVPVSVAIGDNGPGLQRGLVARAGFGWFGLSAAIGNHFGIAATALGLVRPPEASPGRGRGWKQAFGIDAERRAAPFTLRGEAIALRQGETAADRDLTLLDVSATLSPSRYRAITLGWTRLLPDRLDFVRIRGEFFVVEKLTFEPMIRYRGDRFYDVSLALRLQF